MKRTSILATALALSLPLASLAQTTPGAGGGTNPGGGGGQGFGGFGGGGGRQGRGGNQAAQTPAWKQFKLPNKKIKLDFRNANIDMVLAMFTQASGITIVKDPSLKDPISLTTAAPVSLSDAFSILNAALGVRNFQLVKQDNLMVIQPSGNKGGGMGNMDPAAIQAMMSGAGRQSNKIDLQSYKIKYASASAVAKIVNDVFAPSGNSGNPFAGFGGGGFQFNRGGGGPGGRGGRFGGGNFNPAMLSGLGGGQDQPNVRASSDDYSNTVIVNAPRDMQSQIAEVIDEVDKQTDEPQKSKVYKLNYAVSSDLQSVVQNVLAASVPRGRGNTGQQQQGGGGGFFQNIFGGGRGNQQTAGGTVTADTHTNTLVVTTTETNQTTVANLLKELDQPVEIKSSTLVIPLVNARADQMAQLFVNAFGRKTGLNGATNNNNTNTNRTPTTTGLGNNNRNNNTPGGGTLGSITPTTAMNVQLDDNGDVATNVSVQDGLEAQFFGGQQFGGGQNRQGTTGGTAGQVVGRGPDGKLVQVQDLTNQVTVIPDISTNSLIIVTTPDNANLIRQIVAQLDKIPEQVLIETVIVEASLDATNSLGVEWSMAAKGLLGGHSTGSGTSSFGNQANTTQPQGLRWTIAGSNYSAFLNAIQTDTKFNILSTPRIFTSNNVQSQINISQSIPYVTSTRTDTLGNISYTYSYTDVGIVLTVTPRITSGGVVTMDVTQTANDLQGYTSFNAPIVNQRQAQTTASVKDGETIILGGIIRSTVTATTNKIPLLGDIPILGNLFRSKSQENHKTELMVFLTPRIVRNPGDASNITKEQAQELSQPTKQQLGHTGKILGEGKPEHQGKPLGGGDQTPPPPPPDQKP